MAYAKAEGLKIKEIAILKTKLTGTQIVEFAERLQLVVTDSVNQEHPSYKGQFGHHNFSTNDWIKTMCHNPIMKQPIALRGNTIILVEISTDIIKIYGPQTNEQSYLYCNNRTQQR